MRPIDADTLLVQEKEWAKDGGFYSSIYDGFQKRILSAPTIDYAPVVHGEWIRQDETYTRFQCSSCKSENHGRRWLFCPICGAKMDSKK